MNIKVIKALYKKEITDILRDKKTILMMVVVPLVLYPLIFIASIYFASTILTESTTKTFVISLADFEGRDELQDYFASKSSNHDYSITYYNNGSEDGLTALENKKISAYVERSISDNGIQYFTVYFNASDSSSQTAATMIETLLSDYENDISKYRVKSYGLDDEYVLNPVRYSLKNIASNEKTVGNLFGIIVPYLLIASVLMGAMYPAIDVTSGEKERGTLETLLTLPVKNIEMILSKFMATATIATGTAFLNVFSLGLMGFYFYSVMEETGEIGRQFNISLYIPAVILTLLLAIIFAMLVSAVCLSVCIFARSFKEAQNYTTPVMLVFMFAGMVAFIPSIELNEKNVIIPVVNFAILISDIFTLEYNFSLILEVMAINLAYTLLAIIFMTKVFSSENILFGDGTNGIRIIEKRSEMKEKSIPGIGDVILLFSVLTILMMTVGSIMVLKVGIYGAMIQQAFMILLPLFYAWYIKADFKKVFRLGKPKIVHFVGGFLAWAGTFILMQLLVNVFNALMPSKVEEVENSLDYLMSDSSVVILVIAVAILPAICEEIAFRGFLFGTLSGRMKIWPAIIMSALVFGLYHGSIVRLPLTAMLGGVFAYVIYRTGSITVSMFMHFLNNFISVMLSEYETEVMNALPILAAENVSIGVIIALLLAGISMLSLGILIINKTTKC